MSEQMFSYRKVRTVSETIRISLAYVKKHYRTLFAPVALYALPCLLLSSFLECYLTGNNQAFEQFFGWFSNLQGDAALWFAMAAFLYLAGLTLQTYFVNRHVTLNDEGRELAIVNLRGENFQEDIRQLSLNALKIYMFTAAFVFLCFYVLDLSFHVNFNTSTLRDLSFGGILNILVELIFVILVLLGAIPLFYFFTITSLFFASRENMSVTKALSRIWDYAGNNLFKVWAMSITSFLLTYLVISLAQTLIALLIFLPDIIRVGTLHAIADNLTKESVIVIDLISTVFILFLSLFFQVSLIFYFGGLEESKEGQELKEKIENVS